LGTSAGEGAHHSVITFMTGVFKQLAVTLRQRDFDSPRPRPCRRIVDCELINERVRIQTLEALGEFHILAASAKWILVREIRGLDDKRVAFPMASRVPLPQADILSKMGTPIRR